MIEKLPMAEPIDTTKLDTATLAKHLACPQGEIGKAVTANLNKSNAGGYSAALAKLDIKDGERVIEIGYGNGHEIPRVLSQARDVTYFGVDASETMLADAREFNANAIRENLVTLVQGTSSAIPAQTHSFDKALTLNTIYFWSDPVIDLRELRRVVRRGGRLVLGALAPRSAVGRSVYQHGFRLYEEDELKELLARAGFACKHIDTINETVVPPTGQPWNRDYFIVAGE
jgi:SAM-dependent methyltransferase